MGVRPLPWPRNVARRLARELESDECKPAINLCSLSVNRPPVEKGSDGIANMGSKSGRILAR